MALVGRALLGGLKAGSRAGRLGRVGGSLANGGLDATGGRLALGVAKKVGPTMAKGVMSSAMRSSPQSPVSQQMDMPGERVMGGNY